MINGFHFSDLKPSTKFVVVLQPTVHSITLKASRCFGVPWVEHGLPVQKPTVFSIYPFWKKKHFVLSAKIS